MHETPNPTSRPLHILRAVSPTAFRREAKSPVGGYKAESFNPDPVLNAVVGLAVPFERVRGVFPRLPACFDMENLFPVMREENRQRAQQENADSEFSLSAAVTAAGPGCRVTLVCWIDLIYSPFPKVFIPLKAHLKETTIRFLPLRCSTFWATARRDGAQRK